jgi:chromosome segregation ATPase
MTQQNSSMTVDINSDYIQALYAERDEALARNRELEAGAEHLRNALEARKTFIKSIAFSMNKGEREREEKEKKIAQLEGENTVLLTRVQALEEEKAGLECCYDVERKAHTATMTEKMELEVDVQALRELLQETLNFLPYDTPQSARKRVIERTMRDALVMRIKKLLEGEPCTDSSQA